MHATTILSSLALLPFLAQAQPNPMTTLPNGVSNPFYPCPAIDTYSCPYRCYSTSTNGTTTSTTLLESCYTEPQAASFLEAGSGICLKCTEPTAHELAAVGLSKTGVIISNGSATPACEPVRNYLDGGYPSKCGSDGHRLDECAWLCGEAQVPFTVCSATNTTGQYSSCDKCVPDCSSPKFVFTETKTAKKPVVKPAFSLSNGTCAGDAALGYGQQVATACPWRCLHDGQENTYYCSLFNQTAEYTTCERC